MTSKNLEPVIYCPQCGEQTAVKLESVDNSLFDGLQGFIFGNKDINTKSRHYSSKETCGSCGAMIFTGFTVTAVKDGGAA
jgi:predicted RNA-binding Zn-ribbon protein involved in translation (DUF1610 family)